MILHVSKPLATKIVPKSLFRFCLNKPGYDLGAYYGLDIDASEFANKMQKKSPRI